MTPERWRRITEVFHLARTYDAAARTALLDDACAGDPSLREQVDALLAAEQDAGQFGESPLLSFPGRLHLEPGLEFGAYRVDALIGSGGMGEVYRAHDARLDRHVAIKVLSTPASPESSARLLREARSAASLNHPNVCTIHEVGEIDGDAYIAMELIEGSALDRLIPPEGLPVEELFRYGLQIADAIAYAHGRGIVHRDLKPANVMVSTLGIPKILDFGLAGTGSVPWQAAREFSTSSGTGAVLGTAAYMAPEQALGRATDERCDVFSYGVMLYEMATGRPPFSGATSNEVLDAVLHAEAPTVSEIRRDLPVAFSRIVQKTLAKDPSQRYPQISEVAALLRQLRPSAPRRTTAARAAAVVVPLVLLVAGAVWSAAHFREETTGLPTARIMQMTTLPGIEYSPAWSRDGRSLAYVSDAAGNMDIYVQQTGSAQAVRVTDSPADDVRPAWSPDGSRIAFVSARAYQEKRLSMLIGLSRVQSILPLRNGDVWVMPATGGNAQRVAEHAYDPAWSPDGKRLVYAGAIGGEWGLWIRDVDRASEPQPLMVGAMIPAPRVFDPPLPVPISPGTSVMIQPAWSPDGKWIAFTAGRTFLQVFVVRSEGGQASPLTPPDTNTQMPSWSPDGRWLYVSSERSGRINLYKASFLDGRLGPMHPVTAGSGADLQAQLDPQGRRLAYASVRDVVDLWEYDLKSAQATRLSAETAEEDNARPSPDDAWLTFTSNRLPGSELWLLSRRTGALTPLTTPPNSVLQATRWSRDGQSLLYRNQSGDIWRHEVTTGAVRKLYDGNQGDGDFCVPDSKSVILTARSGAFVRVDLASARRQPVGLLPEGAPSDLACSPDGRWVAAHVKRADDDDRDIWLMSLATGVARQLTSGDNEDSHPVWSADSRVIYFLRNHQDVYAVSLGGGEAAPVTRYRSLLVTLDYPALSGDGKKILFTRIDKTGDIYVLEQPPG